MSKHKYIWLVAVCGNMNNIHNNVHYIHQISILEGLKPSKDQLSAVIIETICSYTT